MATAVTTVNRGDTSGVVMLSPEDEANQVQPQQISTKKLGTYLEVAKKNTQFFTTYDPDLIFDDLQKELH